MTPGPEAGHARLFVACDLPSPVLRAVSEWQAAQFGGREDLRVTRDLHLTLAFLGDVARDRVDRLAATLATIAFTEVAAAFAGPLFLPERGRKTVVALRLDDGRAGFATLQAAVSSALAREGLFTPERRAWLPHVTVARFRRPGHPFSLQNVTIPQFGVVRMVLYSSDLKQSGAVHTPIAVFPAS